MSLYAEGKVRVDNNQLQDQACDPLVVIEQGFKSTLPDDASFRRLQNTYLY